MTISRTANVFNLIKPSAYETSNIFRSYTHVFSISRSRLFTPPWGIYTHIAYIKSSSRKKKKKSEHHHAMWLLYNACVHRDTTFLVFFCCQLYDDNESTLVVTMTESADPSLFSLSIELHKHKLTSKSLALSTYTHIKLEKRVEMSPVLILPRRGMNISLFLRAELKSIWIFFRGGWRFNNNPWSIFLYILSDGQSINKFMMIPYRYREE